MARASSIDAVQGQLPTLIRTLRNGRRVCAVERRDDRNNGLRVGGGLQMKSSSLYLELPRHFYTHTRHAWYLPQLGPAPMGGPPVRDVKCLPPGLLDSPAARSAAAQTHHFLSALTLGDGSSFAGEWERVFSIPGFRAGDYADIIAYLKQTFPHPLATAANPMVPLGPFYSSLEMHGAFEEVVIGAAAMRAAAGSNDRYLDPSCSGKLPSWGRALVVEYDELLSLAELPPCAAHTISGVPYPAAAARPLFNGERYAERFRHPTLYQAGVVEVGAEFPYCPGGNPAMLVGFFFSGSSVQFFLQTLMAGGTPLSRMTGKKAYVRRCHGWLAPSRKFSSPPRLCTTDHSCLSVVGQWRATGSTVASPCL